MSVASQSGALPAAVERRRLLTALPRRLSPGALLLVLPALLLMVPIYAFPTLGLLARSINAPDVTLAYYRQALSDPSFWPVMLRTFSLVAQVTLLSAVVGYPLAYAMLRASDAWRKLIMVLIVLPIWTSVLVRSFSWVVILGRDGALNHLLLALGVIDAPIQFLYTRFAVVLGLVHVMLPFFVIPLYGVMSRLDLRLVAAAQSAGASPRRAFLTVFFPLSLPGVASGAILIFILSIGFFVTPALLGGLGEITYIMQIDNQVEALSNWPLAAAMSMVLLIVTIVLVAVLGRALGFGGGQKASAPSRKVAAIGRFSVWLATRFVRWSPDDAGVGNAAVPPPRRSRRRLGPWLTATVAASLTFIVLPILLLFPLSFSDAPYFQFPPSHYSFRWYENYLSRGDWTAATWTSFEVATITMIAAIVVGGLAALGLSRARFRGANLVLGFLLSPMIVPSLIIAIGLYFQLARLRLVGSLLGLVLGHMILAIPLVVIIILNALRGIDLQPERAARSLGAGAARAFRDTTLVAIRPSLIAAAFFAFLASFDDVIMAMFLSGVRNATLPRRMWDGIAVEVDPTVAAASTLLVIFSVVLFAASQWVSRRAERAATRHDA